MSATRLRRGAWLLAAVSIVAVLALVVVPRVLEKYQGTRCPKWRSDVLALEAALAQYAADHGGTYPTTLDALLSVDPRGIRYIGTMRIPRDPWRNEYRYAPPGARNVEPRVWCVGPDGINGTLVGH